MIGKNLAFFFFIFSLTCCLNIQPSGNNSSSSGNSSDSGKPSDSPSDSGGSSSGSQKEPDWVLTKMTTEYNLSTNLTVNIDGENVEYNKYISETTYDYDYYNDSLNYFYNTKTVNKYYLNNSYIGEIIQIESKFEHTSNGNLKTLQKTYTKDKETGDFYLSSVGNQNYVYYPSLPIHLNNKLYDYNGNIYNTSEYYYDVVDLGMEEGLHKYKYFQVKSVINGVETQSNSNSYSFYCFNEFGKISKIRSAASLSSANNSIIEVNSETNWIYGKYNTVLSTFGSSKTYYINNNEKSLQSSTTTSVEDIELVKETNNELVYSFNYYQTDTNGVKSLVYKQTKTFTKM